MRRIPVLTFIALAFALGTSRPADAQSMGDRLKKRAEESAKRKVEQRVDQRAGEATDKALDKAEGAVKCAATNQACIDKAKAEGKPVAVTDDKGAVIRTEAVAAGTTGAAEPAKLKPGEGAWANFDFVPGSRLLFTDDFTKDNVGDFPRRFEFQDGNMEIVEWQGGRYLRVTHGGNFHVVLPEVLPDRFTMEFDFSGTAGSMYVYLDRESNQNAYLIFAPHGSGGIQLPGRNASSSLKKQESGRFYHASVMGDGDYIKVYLDDTRVANVPNAKLGRSNKITFWTDGYPNDPMLFGNFRIAAGGKKLYDALTENGRVATQGIYFDTGSDRIRPESSPTLKEIGAMLKEHDDLTLLIEGHTDNVGSAATNQSLSQKRAEAVRQVLITTYGVDGARLTAKGLGASKPMSPNDTPEGRQNNRRVELVKG